MMMTYGKHSRLHFLCSVWALLLFSLVQEGHSISCIQCEADVALGDDECLKKPPSPQPCEPSMSVCMTIRTYIPAEEDTRSLVSVVRTCAPTDMGWDCEKGRNDRGQVAEVCHDTCSWDGCNFASVTSPSRTTMGLVTAVFVFLNFVL